MNKPHPVAWWLFGMLITFIALTVLFWLGYWLYQDLPVWANYEWHRFSFKYLKMGG